MDVLEILQTIGICVGSLALVAIAVMIFLMVSTFIPTPMGDFEVIELDEFPDEAESDEPPKRRRQRNR